MTGWWPGRFRRPGARAGGNRAFRPNPTAHLGRAGQPNRASGSPVVAGIARRFLAGRTGLLPALDRRPHRLLVFVGLGTRGADRPEDDVTVEDQHTARPGDEVAAVEVLQRVD